MLAILAPDPCTTGAPRRRPWHLLRAGDGTRTVCGVRVGEWWGPSGGRPAESLPHGRICPRCAKALDASA